MTLHYQSNSSRHYCGSIVGESTSIFHAVTCQDCIDKDKKEYCIKIDDTLVFKCINKFEAKSMFKSYVSKSKNTYGNHHGKIVGKKVVLIQYGKIIDKYYPKKGK